MDGKEELLYSRLRIYLILAGLCLLVYVNSLNNAFISDDIPAIVRNPFISQPFRFWLEPVVLLNSLNYLISGYNPFSYHLTNIILHSVNTILVFFFLRLFFEPESSLLAASLFAIHPIHTEAVTWISGRAYLVLALFILITYLLYHSATAWRIKGRRFNLTLYLLCLLIFSYFTILHSGFYSVLPLLLILSDVTFKKWKKNWKLWVPFLAIGILGLILAKGEILRRVYHVSEEGVGRVAWSNPIFNIAYSLFTNFSLLLWPAKLTLYHEPIVISHLALKGIIILLFLLVCSLPFIFKKAKVIFFGIVLFILFLIPTYSPVVVCCMLAERYLYFPSIILSIFAAFLYDRYAKESRNLRKNILILFIFIITAYALRTMIRNEDWRSPQRFWRATLKVSYNSSQAHNMMGDIYRREGNFKEAVRELKKAIEISPRDAIAYNNLGVTYVDTGNKEEAIASYKKAIEIDPKFAEAYFNIGNIYAALGNKNEAIASYNKVIEVNPNVIEAYINLGAAYTAIGNKEEAIAAYKKAIELNPRYAVAHNNLAVAYYYEKQYDLAIKHCDRAIKLGYRVHPDFLRLLESFRE